MEFFHNFSGFKINKKYGLKDHKSYVALICVYTQFSVLSSQILCKPDTVPRIFVFHLMLPGSDWFIKSSRYTLIIRQSAVQLILMLTKGP